MCEEDVLTIPRSPYSVISSDSSTSDGRTGGHPRAYANFGYALVHFVKEHKAISLEALVKKMTSQPDFAHPHESPEGIKYVLVNGQLAVSEGEVTGVKGGGVLGKR